MKTKGILIYCILLLAIPTLAAINRTVFTHPIPEKMITGIPDLILLVLFSKTFFEHYTRGDASFLIPDIIAIVIFFYSLALSLINDYNGILGFRISGAKILLYFIVRMQNDDDVKIYEKARIQELFLETISKILIVVGFLGYVIVYILPKNIIESWYIKNSFIIGYYFNVRRMDSIFWSPVAFAASMTFTSLYFFHLFLRTSVVRRKITALIWFLFVSSCNLLSLSRGAWVSEAIGVFILLAIERDKLRSMSIIMIAIILSGTVILSNNSIKNQFLSIFNVPELGTGQIPRLEQREQGINEILHNPLGFGVGSSGYIGARMQGAIKAVTDNWYLKTTKELGIFGLILYFAYFIVLLISITKTVFSSYFTMAPFYLAFILGFLFESYGSNMLDFEFMGSVFWIVAGFAVNISFEKKPEIIRVQNN